MTLTEERRDSSFEERLLVELRATHAERFGAQKAGRSHRLWFAGVGTAAAAAVVVGVLLAGSQPRVPSQQKVELTAARFLERAAAAVVRQPSSAPLANQFVFTETEDPSGAMTETWLSADGSRPAMTSNGANSTIPSCTVAMGEAGQCHPNQGAYPDLPTTPDAALGYLEQTGLVNKSDTPGDPASDNDIAKGVAYLMQTAYLTAPQRAALFQLLAETPGFTLDNSATDATGRAGVGVEWSFEGGRGELIVDPSTFAYLGDRTWPSAAFTGVSGPYDGSALIQMAIVDVAGQQP